MARAMFLKENNKSVRVSKFQSKNDNDSRTYVAMVRLSSALIVIPDSCKYSKSEIFCGKKMCITFVFLLKHMPSIGSRYLDLRF